MLECIRPTKSQKKGTSYKNFTQRLFYNVFLVIKYSTSIFIHSIFKYTKTYSDISASNHEKNFLWESIHLGHFSTHLKNNISTILGNRQHRYSYRKCKMKRCTRYESRIHSNQCRSREIWSAVDRHVSRQVFILCGVDLRQTLQTYWSPSED